MLVIGLTGGIGSGKTTVANFFAALGVPVIDTDQLARDVVVPNSPALIKIIARHGPDILLPDKSLNRQKLREIIFKDASERQWLEQLLHPLIRKAMQEKITALTEPYCIVVIPLLAETAPNELIDRVLVVDAPEKEQLLRTQQRDQLSHEAVKAIIQAQAHREKRLAIADDIIMNNGDLAHLQRQVAELHYKYLQLCKK